MAGGRHPASAGTSRGTQTPAIRGRTETLRRRGRSSGRGAAELEGQAEGLGQGVGGQRAADRAGRDDLPGAQQQHVGQPGRDLLDVVSDHHRAARPGRRPGRAGAPGPRGRRGRGRPRARRAAAAPGRSSAPGRSAPACVRPRTASRTCARRDPRRARRAAPRHASASISSYLSRQRPTTAYDAVSTTSRTVSRAAAARPGPRWTARSAAVARRRRSRRAPRRGSRPPGSGTGGGRTCSSVVLPAPLGPRTTQRSPSATSQSSRSTRVAPSRRTLTARSPARRTCGPTYPAAGGLP